MTSLDNDANVAALAEHRFGAAKGTQNAVMLTIGTGIGGGVIIDGELYRGSIGAACEPGHMVIDLNGPPCQGTCPNHGCMESLASGTALAREGAAAAGRIRLCARPRPGARGRRQRQDGHRGREGGRRGRGGRDTLVGTHLGVGLASLANIFNPDVLVIGGGVTAAGDLLLGPAREELRKRALPPMNETPVHEAVLGGDAGMIGAAAMALEESGAVTH